VSGPKVIVIGAGIGGLTAGAILSRRGFDVTILERARQVGGKLRTVEVGGRQVDSGPTVLTMKWVFDAILEQAGGAAGDFPRVTRASTLARHFWSARECLDLKSDPEASADAIGRFAGAREAHGFRRFTAAAQSVYRTLEQNFLRASEPSLKSIVADGLLRPGDLLGIRPFSKFWQELGRYFRDPRLQQLFARYATYCGASPYLAPATLMLIAHVEQEGVWLVEGGMMGIAEAFASLARSNGATIRLETEAARIGLAGGQVAFVDLADGERLTADAVVFNADLAALARGLFGSELSRLVPEAHGAEPSLSAITWSVVARTSGARLARHTVFFSDDYRAEFDALIAQRRPPERPTVYVCAQDRDSDGHGADGRSERLLCLINAPPVGGALTKADIDQAGRTAFETLRNRGLDVEWMDTPPVVTSPSDFARLFPGSGGALYGRAIHGWKASFERPGVRSRLPGLYLAGGGVHPGAGLPMVALSGLNAARCLEENWVSSGRFRRGGISGGTSMGSATTVGTRSR
jgi:1-hydroxycarotenoid 3,4-desaturase